MDWVLATRFQPERDLVIASGTRTLALDPSLNGERVGSKAGYDLTWPLGSDAKLEMRVPAPPQYPGKRFETVEAALDALPGGEEAILLGHSRGGIVISEAGAHRRVGSLIYLTAFLLEAGETFGPAAGELRAPLGNDRFYNDCPDEQVAWAAKQLRPTFMGGAPFTPSRLAWAQKPTTYVVCTLDAAIPVADQRTMALRAG